MGMRTESAKLAKVIQICQKKMLHSDSKPILGQYCLSCIVFVRTPFHIYMYEIWAMAFISSKNCFQVEKAQKNITIIQEIKEHNSVSPS